jgi:hypothetical protein
MPRARRPDPFRRRPELERLEDRTLPGSVSGVAEALRRPEGAATAEVRPAGDTNAPHP